MSDTALHRVIDGGDTNEIVRMIPDLIEHINTPNSSGWTPLRCAVFGLIDDENGAAVIKALLDSNGDSLASGGCKGGLLPIHEAVRRGKIGFVRLLIDNNPELINEVTTAGLQPIHYAPTAPVECREEMLALLFQRGADREAKTIKGNRPSHYAGAAMDSQDPVSLVIRVYDLCRCEEDVKNSEGWTAFGKLIQGLIRRVCILNSNPLRLQPRQLTELMFSIDAESAEVLLKERKERSLKEWETRHLVFSAFCRRLRSMSQSPF